MHAFREQKRLAAVATEAVDKNQMKRYDQVSGVSCLQGCSTSFPRCTGDFVTTRLLKKKKKRQECCGELNVWVRDAK